MSYTAGELEAFDPPLASHQRLCRGLVGLPLFHSRQNTTTIIPRTKSSAQDRSSRKSPIYQLIMAKAGLAERVERRCAACSPSAIFSWPERSFTSLLLPANRMSCRMRAFLTDSVKTRDFCDVHDYHDLQNTRQHFGHSVYSFHLLDFLTFCFLLFFSAQLLPSPFSYKLPHSLWYFR
jgi:hypothetical protein